MRHACISLCFCTTIIVSACTSSAPPIAPLEERTELDSLVTTALSFAVDQYGRTAASMDPADGYPRAAAEAGGWTTVSINDWTSGFFPGILWQLAEYTGDPQFEAWAQEWTVPLSGIFAGSYDHDLGFQFMSSFGLGLRQTRNEAYRITLLEAAQRLADRYNPTVGAIKSWDWSAEWEYPVIADNMMNLELLLWGAANGGEATWRNWAIQHARTTARDHVRADGGSFHVVDYDTSSGRIRSRVTHQGAADSSTWARGQAWLIYGFTMMYRETTLPEFAETARRLADYFIHRLPPDAIPYWDFQAPGRPSAPRDASAAAIACSALLELSSLLDRDEARVFRETAERILTALVGSDYLARDARSPALLRHAVGNWPAGSEVDVSLIYADFYFVEALRRYLDLRTAGTLESRP